AAPPPEMCEVMSCLVMRPEAPVPETCARSTLFSAAILRTNGEERGRSPAEAAAGRAEGAVAAAGAFAGGAAGAEGFAAGAAAPPPITATTVLMLTVEPLAARISVRVPAAGEGISASTLSEEISKIGSSR